MKCAVCGKDNPTAARFCGQCAAELLAPVESDSRTVVSPGEESLAGLSAAAVLRVPARSIPWIWVVAGPILVALAGADIAGFLVLHKHGAQPIPPAPAAGSASASLDIPDLTGMRKEQAREVISALKFQPDVRTEYNSSVPAGNVISQAPQKGASVAPGAYVRINVSAGPAPGAAAALHPARPPAPQPAQRMEIQAAPAPPGPSPGQAIPLFDAVGTRSFSNSDIQSLSHWDLDVLRNEPYARHGYRFKRSDLSQYFARFRWYHPTTGDPAVVERGFSSIERNNANLIQQYQAHHGMIP